MPLYVPPQQIPDWSAADNGFKTWAYDIHQATTATIVPTAGVLNMVRLTNHTNAAMSVSSGYLFVATAGGTLTNVGFGLYNPTGQALLTSSVNANGATAAAFQSGGLKQVTFTAQSIAAGAHFYLAFWFTGTTMPTLSRASSATGAMVANQATPNLRWATANTTLTTTAPSTYTAQTVAGVDWWAAAA